MKRPKDPVLRHSSLGPERPVRGRPKPASEPRFADEARFIKAWFENPLKTGAVSPSGKVLSRAMARSVDPARPGPVVELGPGTGPVTEALIRRGIAQERLVLLEFDPAFCKLLARRYPRARVIQGDAYDLARSLAPVLDEQPAAVVSSLPLLNKPDGQRLALLEAAFKIMRPDGVFVQFTYGLGSPVPRVDSSFTPAQFCGRGSAPVWLNLPPARVWTYTLASEAQTSEPRPDFLDKLKAGTDKLGDDWRERRRRLRQEFVIRAEKAKAEFRIRTEKVKTGIERHHAAIAGDDKTPLRLFERKPVDRRHSHW